MPFSDKNFNDFLRAFLASIKEELPGNSFKFSDFEAAYEKSSIKIENPNQYQTNEDEELPWIEEFKNILFPIAKVINDPRFSIFSHKEILNVEKIVKIDNQDIIEATQNDSFWQRDANNNLTPKVFTTSINDREIFIYENRFVAYVIDMMFNFVTQNIVRIRKNARYVSQNFIDEEFSFKDVDNAMNLADFKQFKFYKGKKLVTHVPLLTSANSKYVYYLNEMENIKKSLQRMMYTSFYRSLNDGHQLTASQIYPTNLLMGDRNYREIYDFYYRFQMLKVKTPYKIRIYRPWYYDYVGISLLMAFRNLGFSFNKNRILFNDMHHLIIKDYNCEKEGIKAHLNMKDNLIEIVFTVQYIEGKFHKLLNLAKKRENKILLIMTPNPKTTDADDARDLYEELIKKYTDDSDYINAFIVSPHDEFNFRNTVICSPFCENVDLSLENVIQSSLIFAEGDSGIYKKICPICGTRTDGEWDDGNCRCASCNSVWTSLISGDNHKYQNTIWLKAIKRNIKKSF